MNSYKENHLKKALVVTTVASTIDQFCMRDISLLQQLYKVYVSANFIVGNNTTRERVKEFKLELSNKCIEVHEINFSRNPFSIHNFVAYKEIKKIIIDNSFELIHCHTPVAAMIVRIAARKARKNGTKVIYTSHGFHFFNGSPIINWMLFYPIERWLAKYTDVLITINKEDYNCAKKSFSTKIVKYNPGVGIDIKNLNDVIVDKSLKRKELNVPLDAFVVLSVGELNKNKNHKTIIKAIAKLNISNIIYLICGKGILENNLKVLIKKLNLEKQVRLLGYRKDIAEIIKVSDVFAFPSYREGLSVALMEAMALGLPVVCSKIRGNTDLIEDCKGGYLIETNDINGFASAIEKVQSGKVKEMGLVNIEKIKQYSSEIVIKKMKHIYKT